MNSDVGCPMRKDGRYYRIMFATYTKEVRVETGSRKQYQVD